MCCLHKNIPQSLFFMGKAQNFLIESRIYVCIELKRALDKGGLSPICQIVLAIGDTNPANFNSYKKQDTLTM